MTTNGAGGLKYLLLVTVAYVWAIALLLNCSSMAGLGSSFYGCGADMLSPHFLLWKTQGRLFLVSGLLISVGVSGCVFALRQRRRRIALLVVAVAVFIGAAGVQQRWPDRRSLFEQYCQGFADRMSKDVKPDDLVSRLIRIQNDSSPDVMGGFAKGPEAFPEWTSNFVVNVWSMPQRDTGQEGIGVFLSLGSDAVGACWGGEPRIRPGWYDFKWKYTDGLWIVILGGY